MMCAQDSKTIAGPRDALERPYTVGGGGYPPPLEPPPPSSPSNV